MYHVNCLSDQIQLDLFTFSVRLQEKVKTFIHWGNYLCKQANQLLEFISSSCECA